MRVLARMTLYDWGERFEREGETHMNGNGGNCPITREVAAWIEKQWKYQIGYVMMGGG